MWINRLHEVKSLFRHLLSARGPHGVHSPFVYDLITVVLRNKERSRHYSAIEQERKRIRKSSEVIEVDDFGAGSRITNHTKRIVGQVARTALQSASHARALGLLARHARARNILELGTSFGITTAHLAASIPDCRVFTIEGSKSIAQQALNIWSVVGLDSIDSTAGSFAETLSGVLRRMPSVDFVVIDGDHRGEACLRYLETIFPFTNEHTVIVLDDIYWSPSMTEAWQTCIADSRFSLTLDFFDFGVLYRKSGRVKEHFRLARPWR
jgi:predicted O-methyltransferase YrrM